eukprot:2344700-Pyramimonas_sp.AAC.1
MEQVQWDRDKLMQAIRGGPLREQFMRRVEPLLEQEWPYIENACFDPNIVLDRLDQILRTAGADVFKKGPAAGSTRSALAQRRLDLLARRRDLRSKLGEGLTSDEYVACCEELAQLTKQCKALYKAEQQRRREQLVEEIWASWRSRDLASVHRLSLRLAGGRYGKARRDFSRLDGMLPTGDEWFAHLSQAGCDGGLQASRVCWDDMSALQQLWKRPAPTYEQFDERMQQAWAKSIIDMEQIE